MAKKNAVKPQTLIVDVTGARKTLHEIRDQAKVALETAGRRPLSRILILVEEGLGQLRGESRPAAAEGTKE